jgi:hypothetical protein
MRAVDDTRRMMISALIKLCVSDGENAHVSGGCSPAQVANHR